MTDNDTPTQRAPGLTVSEAEQGMKLLRFLERRLREHAPKSMLHKWIRTGQVRVNKKRAGPYDLLEAGDDVRLPPFAAARLCPAPPCASGRGAPPEGAPGLGPGLRVIGRTADCLALAKPAGLAAQPGSGNTDSVAERLRSAIGAEPFIPAPAHRLDKGTSGILLAGMTHAAQSRLHALFRTGAVRKDYLAWVAGKWPHAGSVLLRDVLEKRSDASGREIMAALPGGEALPFPLSPLADEPGGSIAGQALSVALPVISLEVPALSRFLPGAEEATLLLVRLLTGRKHQIRVQLASHGFPVIGDGRHGGPEFQPMLLHALAVSLPPEHEGERGPEWFLLPEWLAPFMPEPGPLRRAQSVLAGDAAPLSPLCSGKAL